MSRPLKFRAWDKDERRMYPCSGTWMGNVVCLLELGVFRAQPEHEVTVMQFTGLLDKNGKEIWEGDIIQLSNTTIWEVYWNEELACFYARGGHGFTQLYDLAGIEKVIGNIYEHPHLLHNGIKTEFKITKLSEIRKQEDK